MKKGRIKNSANPELVKHSKIIDSAQERAEWENVMHSEHRKMSRGAEEIVKLTPYSRKDNWRRPQKGKNNRKALKKSK